MKLFTAGFITESSDLTPIPTTEKVWQVQRLDNEEIKSNFLSDLLLLFGEMAEQKGWSVSHSICAMAIPPGGRTTRSMYEGLRKTILQDLQRAMPVDGVLLQMHGAAMAHGYDDCEGDLLEHIREITGPNIAIGVELDPHCHITKKMMKHATAMILYKTMLHTDIRERAVELFNLIADTLEARVKPVMALFDCRMMNNTGFDEKSEPMKSFFEKVCATEKQKGILSISPVHCFPLADIHEMGSKMLVITDNNSILAQETAKALGMEFFSVGRQLLPEDINVALDKAQLRASENERAIQLIDMGDLAGCGFPTDGTQLLTAMLKRGMTNLAVGFIWDPLAVSICHDAGTGVELMLRIGGKASPLSGMPLDLKIIIERIYTNIGITNGVGITHYCNAAVVRAGETELLLVSKRVFAIDLKAFSAMGISPESKHYLLLKFITESYSDALFAYSENFDYRVWPFESISRPKWPWDGNPFETASDEPLTEGETIEKGEGNHG